MLNFLAYPGEPLCQQVTGFSGAWRGESPEIKCLTACHPGASSDSFSNHLGSMQRAYKELIKISVRTYAVNM